MKKAMKEFALRDGGFTLVELLIAMAMLAAVTAAVFSLYNMQHKVTRIEEDVVDVQQNVRTGMDSILADLKVAGLGNFISPLGTYPTPIDSSSSATDLTINTGSASGAAARLDFSQPPNPSTNTTFTTSVVAGTPITFTLSSAPVSATANASIFNVGDKVKIVSASDKGQPASTSFTVSAVNTPTAGTLQLTPAGSVGTVTFVNGHIISRDDSPGTYPNPNTVHYCIGPAPGCGNSAVSAAACPALANCLLRIVNNSPGDSSVVATDIQNLGFTYVLDNTTLEKNAPVSTDFPNIRAIRVSMTGQTNQTKNLSKGPKSRQLTTVAKIRNR